VIICGDCLSIMSKIPDESISLILCDLPYGTTRLAWDSVIDLNVLWSHYRRIITRNGAIVLFANQPFSSMLIAANPEMYKYSWIWKKPHPTGFLNANFRPLLSFEEILVFSHSGAGAGSKNDNMVYFPQGLVAINKKKQNKANTRGKHIHETVNCGTNNILNSNSTYEQKFTGYPINILEFKRDSPQIHPTQKPVALCEYLIKTYSKENDVVLDNCAGSGTTGVACLNTNRRFILIEIDKKWCQIAKERTKLD